MKKAALAILFCFLAIPLWAVTNISSLPQTLSIPGETYQLTGNLTCNTGTAITVGANGVVIDGKGYTLNFAQTGGGTGIDVAGYDNVEIKNFTFSTAYTSNSTGAYVKHIELGASASAASPNIHDNTFNVLGRQVYDPTGSNIYDRDRGIEGTTATNATITNNTFAQSGVDRGVSILVEGGPWSITHNTFTCTSCTVTTSYPFFIKIAETSSDAISINNNTFTVDSNSTHVYPINGWDVVAAVTVSNNTITHSGTHGRMINPDNASSGWIIQDNTITMNGAGTGNLYGIRYRNANYSGGNCGGNHTIQYNTVDCSGYTGSGTCNPLSIGGYPDASNPCYQTDVKYNYFKAVTGAVSFYQSDTPGTLNATDQDIYCNKIEATSGYPVAIANAANELTDIKFSHNLLTGGSGGKNVSTGVAWSTAVDFCGGTAPTVTTGSVNVSEAPCQDGATECYSTAGVRASHAAVTLGSGAACTLGTGAVATLY